MAPVYLYLRDTTGQDEVNKVEEIEVVDRYRARVRKILGCTCSRL